jgi:hypothetical protein
VERKREERLIKRNRRESREKRGREERKRFAEDGLEGERIERKGKKGE